MVWALSAIHPFSHSMILTYCIRKLEFGSPWETISLPVFCAANVRSPRNIKLGQTPLSQSNTLLMDQRTPLKWFWSNEDYVNALKSVRETEVDRETEDDIVIEGFVLLNNAHAKCYLKCKTHNISISLGIMSPLLVELIFKWRKC